MLIIRKEQMAVFEKLLDSRFHAVLRKHVREYMAVEEKKDRLDREQEFYRA